MFATAYQAGFDDADAGRSSRLPAAAGSSGGAVANATRFVRDWNTTRRFLTDVVQAGDAASAERVLLRFHAEMRGLGLDPDDLADVIAVQRALQWSAVSARNVEPESVRALGRRLAAGMAPGLQSYSEKEKQLRADAIGWETAQQAMEYARLRQDGNDIALVRFRDDALARATESLGRDIRAIGSGLEGLETSRRSGD